MIYTHEIGLDDSLFKGILTYYEIDKMIQNQKEVEEQARLKSYHHDRMKMNIEAQAKMDGKQRKQCKEELVMIMVPRTLEDETTNIEVGSTSSPQEDTILAK